MIKLPQIDIKETIQHAKTVEQNFRVLQQYNKRYRNMYFMDFPSMPRNSDIDVNDWKITPSPSARNEVTGIKRLLDTSELQIIVKEGDTTAKGSDQIERGLKRIVEKAGEGRRARLLSDATLTSSLYGPVILATEFYSDILAAGNLKGPALRHIEKKMYKAPATMSVLNPEECSFEHDQGRLLTFTRKYQLYGSQIVSRFGQLEGKPLSPTTLYIVRDIYTEDVRIVDVENYQTVLASEHGLSCLPIAIGYAGGSELFQKPEEQINPFLFGKMKSELWERETSLLTTIFTNVSMRGLLGPAYAVDPDTAPEKIVIEYAGGMRIIRAKATPIDDRIIDPVVFEVLQKVDDLSGESTIFGQTLGENINQSTFSGLAMLSSAGKLPLVDPERALQQAFGDAFDYILYRIKEEGIDNTVIPPELIPDEYELDVEFKPKLPQDDLRNAQVAASIQGLVSQEWIQENLLQIGDSAAMRKSITKEQVYQAVLGNMLQNPQYMDRMVQEVLGIPAQPPPGPEGMPPEGMPQEEIRPRVAPPGPEGAPPMPEGMTPEMMQALAAGQGGPPMGGPGMEAMPRTGPMIPPAER